MLKKILFSTLFLLSLIVGSCFIYIFVQDEELPVAQQNEDADRMALHMLEAVNKNAWDSTRIIQWTFPKRQHSYIWDKQQHFVAVTWNNNRALIATNSGKAIIFVNGQQLNPTSDSEQIKALSQTAIDYFNNDSFWLNAPFKIFDSGTARAIVTLENGQKGLMVTFKQGGSTPGDSYVWLLDENNRPKSWKIWASIIPIGGLEFTWDNWIQSSTGIWFALNHSSNLLDIPLSDVKTGNSLAELGLAEDLFDHLKE